jgi:hypothetical protein
MDGSSVASRFLNLSAWASCKHLSGVGLENQRLRKVASDLTLDELILAAAAKRNV